MHCRKIRLCLAVLGASAFFCGCASHIPAEQATDIVPLDQQKDGEGTLVARVFGQPRDIRYYINETRIDLEEDIPWWDDARIEIQLRPGYYKVEARYRVRAFAKEHTTFRVLTHRAIPVLPGQTTHLVAEIHKDWRGVPLDKITYFELDEDNEIEQE